MNTAQQNAISLCLALGVLILLGIVFVFLPSGWNLLPLIAMAMGIAWVSVQLRILDRMPGGPAADPPSEARTSGEGGGRSAPISAEGSELARRLNRAFGPITAGMIIDFVDFGTFGPVGLILGVPIGGLAGYWMGRALGLSPKASAWCAVAAGIYCTIPGTEFIPLATIVGAYVRFRESGKGRAQRRRGRRSKNGQA